jgi:hypothetical protein
MKIQSKIDRSLRLIQVLLVTLMLSSCVSNQAVQTVQVGDFERSCSALKSELASLGANFENAKDDSGVTGKNVGLALVFWPGIIVNEVRANKNQDSIDGRVNHLTQIYNEKCLEDSNKDTDSAEVRLQELRSLLEKKLITKDEYEVSRKEVLSKI